MQGLSGAWILNIELVYLSLVRFAPFILKFSALPFLGLFGNVDSSPINFTPVICLCWNVFVDFFQRCVVQHLGVSENLLRVPPQYWGSLLFMRFSGVSCMISNVLLDRLRLFWSLIYPSWLVDLVYSDLTILMGLWFASAPLFGVITDILSSNNSNILRGCSGLTFPFLQMTAISDDLLPLILRNSRY